MPVTRRAAESLASRLARVPELTAGQLLEVVGQVGFALQALHDQGRAHGHVTADAITLHDDGLVTLQSSDAAVIGSPAELAADLAALGRVARESLPADSDPAVRGFLDRLADAGPGHTGDPGDVARTALALAAGSMPAAATRTAVPPPPVTAADAPIDPEQRRVRNRFIAIGAVVVLVGLVLLKACGGGGQAVPDVTGDSYSRAASTLHADGFVARKRTAPAKAGQRVGTVVAEFPAAGSRPRAGTTITVTVAR
jgi:PASTA domain